MSSHLTVGAAPQVQAGRLGGGPINLSLLTRNNSLTSDNLGGKFAVPREFDTGKFASAVVPEGQEVMAMQGTQSLTGLPYTAPGWTVWEYPKEVPSGKTDEKTKQPVMVAHPMAGKPHKIAGTKPGENFVLMFRPLAVQQQVNAAYGAHSTEMMVQEIRGETNGATQGDAGILTNERLNREIGVDRHIEEDLREGTQTVIAGQVQRPVQRVGR